MVMLKMHFWYAMVVSIASSSKDLKHTSCGIQIQLYSGRDGSLHECHGQSNPTS